MHKKQVGFGKDGWRLLYENSLGIVFKVNLRMRFSVIPHINIIGILD